MQALKPHTVHEDQKKRAARFAPRQPGGGRINAQSIRALLLGQIIPSELRRAEFPGRSLSRRAGIIDPAASKPTGLSSLAPARRCRLEREEFKAQQRQCGSGCQPSVGQLSPPRRRSRMAGRELADRLAAKTATCEKAYI